MTKFSPQKCSVEENLFLNTLKLTVVDYSQYMIKTLFE